MFIHRSHGLWTEAARERVWRFRKQFDVFPFPSPACISKYSAGSIFYYPSFHHIHNPAQLEKLQRDLERYLSRKIGFEAVMRIRCTKGNGRRATVAEARACSRGIDRGFDAGSLPRQVCPSTPSTGTSLCAPPTCCPWPT